MREPTGGSFKRTSMETGFKEAEGEKLQAAQNVGKTAAGTRAQELARETNYPGGYIALQGVRVHNLKNISLRIPLGKLVVITGLSGSGKSSLAFDTLYAEGQRRYVQSLSAYARQFLARIPKPDADYIKGVPPAIVIEQRVSNRNPRSTVGTTSEIYHYLRLLYARIGRIYSPVSGKEVKIDTADDVLQGLLAYPNRRAYLLAPLTNGLSREDFGTMIDLLSMEGFTRIYHEGEIISFESPQEREELSALHEKGHDNFYLLVDRFRVPQDSEEGQRRIADSIETAMLQGHDACRVIILAEGEEENEVIHDYSARLEADGLTFQPPTPELFSFNNPLGACPTCEGYSQITDLSEERVIPDKRLSLREGAVACWRGPIQGQWASEFISRTKAQGFPADTPYYQLTEREKEMLWEGVGDALGIRAFFTLLEKQKHKIQNRVISAHYMGRTTCKTCHGKRLREEAGWVRINGRSLPDLVDLPLDEVAEFLENIPLNAHDAQVAKRIMQELKTRIGYLQQVGLGYLTLNRTARTLSGGETQRINLATSLGSALVGSLYILDEPSVGLHPHDTQRLIEALLNLRDIGNTVVVVEHDEEIMRAADLLIDLGPGAGSNGGEIMAYGPPQQVIKQGGSLTSRYLNGQLSILIPSTRRKPLGYLEIEGLLVNNLQNIDVKIPLGVLSVITGVSGSGKSTLVESGILPAVNTLIEPLGESEPPLYKEARIVGTSLEAWMHVDQNPLSRSLRSTPITYINGFDTIRTLFASLPLAEELGFTAGTFSFNVPGGRCDQCEGTGYEVVEMQFMADIEAPCEACHGTRYKEEVRRVRLRGKSISDILAMTIDNAVLFFGAFPTQEVGNLNALLQILQFVGLGYITLGQPTSTLSGGEAQRLKLASYIINKDNGPKTLYLFDEPTTGLHFHDIGKLMAALGILVEAGHSVVVIEHNVEVMKLADQIIDMGPGAGKAGGKVVAQGTPEEVAKNPNSLTAKFIAKALQGVTAVK